MSDDPSSEPLAEHRQVFDRFWSQLPDRQNRTSSTWWFFVLFPEGEAGYGPQQLMFTIASRVGDGLRVNDVRVPGMDLDRPIENGVDRFDAFSLGWYGDGHEVHDPIVHQPARATLSRDGSLVAWADRDDGAKRGGEIRASSDRPLGLEAHFVGDEGEARFEAWGSLDSRVSSPTEAIDVETAVGGANVAAWQRMQFEGDFDLPGGRETLEGLCYFQRVCLNLPLFPWKWIWAFFPDGTAFSAFVPYVGPQLFRKEYRFFSSNVLERATIPVLDSALWDWNGSQQLVEFDSASVTPVLDSGPHPEFLVRVRNQQGDFVEFVATPYGHARNYIDRPVLRGHVQSHWSYNEYLFRTEELEGNVGGRVVNEDRMGRGFGTLEYAWGIL